MHGWINLDKPLGMSSAHAVNCIKKILGVKKAGHSGTLDPLASGILPVAIGEATKTIPYVVDSLKSYLFDVQWGEQRTTDDLEGSIMLRSSLKPSSADIELLLPQFTGDINQTPPRFSAININGVRSYKLARNNEEIFLKKRLVYVKNIKLLSVDHIRNSANFAITCHKGVYVRSIARDLGCLLGCFGYVSYLRRTKVSLFTNEFSLTLEELMERKKKNNLKNSIYSLDCVLDNMMIINILPQEAKKIKNGQYISLNSLYEVKNYDMCYARVDDVPVAICKVCDDSIIPVRVFNI